MQVTIHVSDASQYPRGADAEKWGRNVVTRHWGGDWSDAHERSLAFSTWGTALAGRSAQYMHERREGCAPWDFYVRFVERVDLVYRIELRGVAGASYAEVQPLHDAFFDEPFGQPPNEAIDRFMQAANRSTKPSSPC